MTPLMHVILGLLSRGNPVLLMCYVGAFAWHYGRSTNKCLGQKNRWTLWNLNIPATVLNF